MVGPILPESQGSLGLVNGSFGSAGRVDHLLWVLDGRVGWYSRLGWVAVLLSLPNLVAGWLCSSFGTLGGTLGRKIIFGKDVLHTNLGCFYVTAGAGAGGRALVNVTQKSGMPN